MGLIFVSSPEYAGIEIQQATSDDSEFSMSYGVLCITAISDNQHIRLFYVGSDPKEKIKDLLNREAVDTDLSDRILSLIYVGDQDDPAALASSLPGVQLETKHPVNGELSKLFNIIIDLNDRKQEDKGRSWTREEIADWIESAFDITDISFTPVGVKNETKGLSELTRMVKIQRILPSKD